jgi:hypothetical protein
MLKNWMSRARADFKTPPPTLVVYHQNEAVAELKREGNGFFFRYLDPFFEQGLSPLPGIGGHSKSQFFKELPAFFKERVPDVRRPEIKQAIVENGIDPNDELRMLAFLGAHSITDSFELKMCTAA